MIITITLNPAIDRTLVLEAPVELSAVNSVVLPQFGLPASAILISMTIPPRLDFPNLYPEIKRATARRLTIPPGFT